jgi:peroxiredoxin
VNLGLPPLTSGNFEGLLTPRFWRNFFPIPASNTMALGAPVPDFELLEVRSQKPLRLSSLWVKGPVVVDFTRIFTEHQYCPLCYPHIQALNATYELFQQRGVAVVMVTSTDELQSQKVSADLGLKFPLLSNPSCSIFRHFGTGQALGAPLPAQFVFDWGGQLRYKHLFSFLQPNASIDTLLQVVSQTSR